jgi:hypothetical protein
MTEMDGDVVKVRSDGMLYMYFALSGVLNVALGHGPEHIRQMFAARGDDAPRVLLGTHEPISASEQARLEKSNGLKSGPVVEISLPEFRFRPDKQADGRWVRRIAEGKEKEEKAKIASK